MKKKIVLLSSLLFLCSCNVDKGPLKDDEKINLFIEMVKKSEDNVLSSSIVEDSIIQYAMADTPFQYVNYLEYSRYQDITTVDYYDQSKELYAKEQYFFDENKFYKIHHDLNNSKDCFKQEKAFDSESVDSFLDCSFSNVYLRLLRIMAEDIKDGVDENTEYLLGFDCETYDSSKKNYQFEIYYRTSVFSNQLGNYVTNEYRNQYSIVFQNNKIKRAKITESYLMAIGVDELMQYTYVDSEIEYEYCKEYPLFQDVKYNPSDYELKIL